MRSGWRRPLLVPALIVLCLCLVAVAVVFTRPFDPQPWLEDLGYLERQTSEVYAGLDWAIGDHGLDAFELGRRAERSIREARSPHEARLALETFVAAFKDGHFRLERIAPETFRDRLRHVREWLIPTRLTSETPAEEACRAMSFSSRPSRYDIAFDKLEEFTPIPGRPDRPFRSGVLSLSARVRLGVLRIAFFGARAYPDICREAWEERRGHLEGACDEDCRQAFETQVWDGLLAQLSAELERIIAARVDALLVDITANGGGDDWAEGAARMLSSKPLRCNRSTFIKHAHWVRQIEDDAASLERDLREAPAEAAGRDVVAAARERADHLLGEAKMACDRSAIWRQPHARPDCSLLASGENFSCGLVPYLPPGALAGFGSRASIFTPLRMTYREGVYAGRLFVLVDRHTGSEAEYFAALLQDNDAATILGERTAGAGCGYTNGGVPVILRHARMRAWIPDCVRYRRDGTNANEGVAPDVRVPWVDADGPVGWARSTLGAVRPLLASEWRGTRR